MGANGPPVGRAADGASRLLDLADAAVANHGHGAEKAELHFRALLRADLKHAVGLARTLTDLLAFVDGERERLFAIDVFAGTHGVDGDLGVPVIGRDDGDHVDVVAIEQLAIVFVDVGLAAGFFLAGFGVLGVNVAHGHDVAVRQNALIESLPTVAGADAADPKAVVLALRIGGASDVGRHPSSSALKPAVAAAEVFKKCRRL